MNSQNPNCQLVDFLGDLEKVVSKAINATAVVYTFSYPTEKGASYSFEFQFSSGGVIDVRVDLEQGNTKPATEGSASTNWVVPNDSAEFDNSCVDNALHIKAYAPAATGHLRLKFTGQGSNATTTVLTRARMAIIKTP
jgi:hypothetical protein